MGGERDGRHPGGALSLRETVATRASPLSPGGFAEAVLVRDGAVAAVGAELELARLAPAGTTTVDLRGGLLAPGFTDAHVHPVQAGLERAGATCPSCTASTSTSAPIARLRRSEPRQEWILGGGWDMSAFPGGPAPPLDQLDFLDRPVFLLHRDHHGAWVNAGRWSSPGSPRDTPDPRRRPDRARRRTAARSGTLHEGAMDLVGLLLPATRRRATRRRR